CQSDAGAWREPSPGTGGSSGAGGIKTAIDWAVDHRQCAARYSGHSVWDLAGVVDDGLSRSLRSVAVGAIGGYLAGRECADIRNSVVPRDDDTIWAHSGLARFTGISHRSAPGRWPGQH